MSRFNKSTGTPTTRGTRTRAARTQDAPPPAQVLAPDVSGDGSDSPAAATVEAAVGGDPSHVERADPQASEGDATATMTDEGAPAPSDEQAAPDEGTPTKKRRLGRRRNKGDQHG